MKKTKLTILLISLVILVSCSKKEELKQEKIVLSCTGIQETQRESTRPKGHNYTSKFEKTTLYKLTRDTNGTTVDEWNLLEDDTSLDVHKTRDLDDGHTKRYTTIDVSEQFIKFQKYLKSDTSPEGYSLDSEVNLVINRFTGEFSKRYYFLQTWTDKTIEKNSHQSVGKCESGVQKF